MGMLMADLFGITGIALGMVQKAEESDEDDDE